MVSCKYSTCFLCDVIISFFKQEQFWHQCLPIWQLEHRQRFCLAGCLDQVWLAWKLLFSKKQLPEWTVRSAMRQTEETEQDNRTLSLAAMFIVRLCTLCSSVNQPLVGSELLVSISSYFRKKGRKCCNQMTTYFLLQQCIHRLINRFKWNKYHIKMQTGVVCKLNMELWTVNWMYYCLTPVLFICINHLPIFFCSQPWLCKCYRRVHEQISLFYFMIINFYADDCLNALINQSVILHSHIQTLNRFCIKTRKVVLCSRSSGGRCHNMVKQTSAFLSVLKFGWQKFFIRQMSSSRGTARAAVKTFLLWLNCALSGSKIQLCVHVKLFIMYICISKTWQNLFWKTEAQKSHNLYFCLCLSFFSVHSEP